MKKKLSLLLAMIIMISSLSISLPAHAAMSTDDKYDILCSLGFFDENSVYTPNTSVTRGEIITALVGAMPEDKYVSFSKGDTGFTDVSSNDPIARDAYNARLLGIVGDETELRPYDMANLEEASFMILNVLGYGKAVKTDYSAYASSLGITKSIPSSSKFTKEQLVIMLYNALDTEILQWEMTELGNLSTTAGKTYLTEVLDAGYGRGIVQALRFSALSGFNPTYTSEVIIGGEKYYTDLLSLDGIFGEDADVYYRNNSDDEKVIVYAKAHDNDRVIEIDAENINSFDKNNLKYTYYTGAELNKSKTASITKTTNIIYNGKNILGDFDAYTPAVGKVKLIDNDGNGKYDVAVITDYDVVVVNGADKENGVVRDLFHPEREYTVDLYASSPAYQVTTIDGEVRKFTDIMRYNVIFAAQSMDKEVTTFIVPSQSSIKGSVEATEETKIKIDGKVYKVTADFFGTNPTTGDAFNSVKIRSNGTFYLDPYGRVGYFETLGDRSLRSGYLIKASLDDSGDEDFDSVLVKMFTEGGKVEKLYTAKNVRFTNGRKLGADGRIDSDYDDVKIPNAVITAEDLADNLNAARDTALGGGQLILFKQNGQGRINEIQIPMEYADISYESEKYFDKSEVFRQVTSKITKTHKSGGFMSMTTNDFRIGPDTKVFSIPSDIANEDKFAAYTGTKNCFLWNQQYTVVAFKKNANSSYADYVVGFLGGSNAVQNQDNVFIIDSVGKGLNEDDDPVPVVKGMWTGRTANAEREFTLTTDAMDNLQYEIAPGNIYALAIDESNNVVNMKEVCVPSMNYASGGWGENNYAYPFYRSAYDLVGKTLVTSSAANPAVTKVSETSKFFVDQFTYVYKYNTKTNKLSSADYTDIKTYRQNPSDYSKVFAMLYCGDDIVMVIYE